jgi:hypothetical protein
MKTKPQSGGGSDDGGVINSLKHFLTDDGAGIKWEKLGTTVVWTGIASIVVGISSVIHAQVSALVGLLGGFANFLGELLEAGFGLIIGPGQAAWGIATGIVSGLNSLWAPIAVLGVVLAYLYIAGWTDG